MFKIGRSLSKIGRRTFQIQHSQGFDAGNGGVVGKPGWLYKTLINRAFDRVLTEVKETAQISLNLSNPNERWIIFSDHHKGTRDHADDFARAESVYHAALGYYNEKGYKLVVLGDAEELWENFKEPVIRIYSKTLKFESKFNDAYGRYFRMWGNHDDDWKNKNDVKNYLMPHLSGPRNLGLEVKEGLLLNISNGQEELGKILLTHGHQGTIDSDTLGGLSRFVVRYLWRPIQRFTRISLNTPSTSTDLRHKHDIALYSWVKNQEKLVLIAGHTHHPTFDPKYKVRQTGRKLQNAIKNGDISEIAEARANFEAAKVFWYRQGFLMEQSCYFNTGCCSFSDGDITGIDISDKHIKLIRWSSDSLELVPNILAKAELEEVFQDVAGIDESEVRVYWT